MATYDPIPEPLAKVLQSVLHANLFSNWRSDLLSWELDHPEEKAKLRQQIATGALKDTIDPGHFSRLSGHPVADPAAAQAWFTEIFKEFYGREPQLWDI